MLPELIFVPTKKGFERLNLSSLLYVRQTFSCAELVTTEAVIQTDIGILQLERILSPNGYCRVHAAYLVSISKIIAFDNRFVQLPGLSIPIGPEYRDQFHQRLRFFPPAPEASAPGHWYIGPDGRLKRVSGT